MNFQVSLGEGPSQESRVVVANSWSTCLAYSEGTGLQIKSIQSLLNVNMVIFSSGTTNCYQLNLKIDGLISNYMVWASDYATFNTWLDSQTNAELNNLQLTNKLYVTV
jgi:hypothetical protein